MPAELPHPRTGVPHRSPVPPGTGWPADPASRATPVATSPAEVAALAGAATDLDALQAASSVCRACPRLVDWREAVAATKRRAYADEPYWGRPVPSFGDPGAWLLVVGLAPGAHGANRTGRLFTGDRSGDWIVAALHRAGLASRPTSTDAADGLTLVGARMVAPVRCVPPENKPTTAERHTCAPWLRRELAMLPDVRALLALGAIGWSAALGAARDTGWSVPRPAPRFGHGSQAALSRPDGTVVALVGSYHVSQQNTQTGRLTQAMLDEAIALAARLAGADGRP
ncbi:uracil-DNA glycosylase [Isoptericola sp. b490]|uniref:uracil-DNA glycosylase n=1 Tax=Actinotalea lenta TaxID=3064654 RepID=UPI0027124E77|nr:uracil-DNA glycosylase [Isoptericola sp. b490]MDO8121459.1 uracil-DNA glycosylase [Isoptericola sp. b490]